MKPAFLRNALITAAAAAALTGCAMFNSGAPTTFFITSATPSSSGNLGGISGADAICERLASNAGVGGRNWRAYLSTQGPGAVNARDRIGNGPWTNAKGVVIARNLAELHGTNNITSDTGLTESGASVPFTRNPVNKHDIMTGSRPDGTAMPADRDATCSNWTSGDQGGAMVGHFNRGGTNPDPVANVSWNSSHITPGCNSEAIARVGGAGLFYCFAAK